MRDWLCALIGFALTACSPPLEVTEIVPVSELAMREAAPAGRLPSSPYPTAYTVDLFVDPREARFGGVVTIDVHFDMPSSGFYLHGRDLDVASVMLSTGEATVPGTWYDVHETGVAWVQFPQMMGPGIVSVAIDYSTAFDVNLSGLFKVTEQGDAYALAKSESIQARRFMPGFDEPAFKAPVTTTLTIPEGMEAITNTLEAERHLTGSGHERITFEVTRPLPTYLLSLAVGSFDVVEAGELPPNEVRSEPIPLRGFARRGKGPDLAYALETAPELVRIFEEALQVPYPYKKLDIVAAPQWPSGATELAAALTYRESRILAGPDMGPAARRSLLAIHAHEVGHMWFGNLVTPPWWDDLWLKEAFASWGEGASLSVLEPEGRYELDAIADGIRAMELDSLSSARAVREPITRSETIRSAYDAITYYKGLAVIGMVDAYFGADVFRPALGKYVEAYEDSIADSPQFFDIIGDVTGEPDLTEAFQSFVEQNGLPLITANHRCREDGLSSILLMQDRYRPIGSDLKNDREWTIPICMKVGSADGIERKCHMLNDAGWEVLLHRAEDNAACPTWVMPNAEGTGYYRFSLNAEQWQELGQAFDLLTPGEQMSTLDSIGAEFAAGRIDVDTVWRFIDEAARADERRVVSAAIRQAERLKPLVENDPDAFAGYKAQIADIFSDRLTALEQHGGDGENEAILRTALERVMVEVAEDPVRREILADAALLYVTDATSDAAPVLTSDNFSTAFAIAIQDRGAPMLEASLTARTEFDDPALELAIAYAIGENRDPALTLRILDLALNGTLGSRESLTLVRGQMAQPETRAETWDWLRENFDAFVDVIPRQRRFATPSLAVNLCEQDRIDELETLFAAKADLVPGYERSLEQTKERLQLCIALNRARGDSVRAYFQDR
ncbi:MAG: M1 family metallopeptidase [Henriciella sp.]|nr:M1 family metallopeptidase [Henriciella sp.]